MGRPRTVPRTLGCELDADRPLAVWILSARLPSAAGTTDTFPTDDKPRNADDEVEYTRRYLSTLQLPTYLDSVARTTGQAGEAFPHCRQTPLATPSSRPTPALHSSSPALPPRFRRARPTRPQRILPHPSHPLRLILVAFARARRHLAHQHLPLIPAVSNPQDPDSSYRLHAVTLIPQSSRLHYGLAARPWLQAHHSGSLFPHRLVRTAPTSHRDRLHARIFPV